MERRRKGPKSRPNPISRKVQALAESVIRKNSPIRWEYDQRECKPPISDLQGRPAIEVAGHIIARLHEAGSASPELNDVSQSFRDNAIAVRIIEMTH